VRRPADHTVGLLAAGFAFTVWGFFPLFFKQLDALPPAEILAWRIVCSFLTLATVMVFVPGPRRILAQMRALRRSWLVFAAAILISVNWLIFIHAITHEQILESSLGYFLVPIVNTALGMAFFAERPDRWRQASMVMAACGMGAVFVVADTAPWISLSLAASFGLYGAVRKAVDLDSATGLLCETTLLVPIAVLYLVAFGTAPSEVPDVTRHWLMASGVLTLVPLFAVVVAARRIEMGTLGFFQYITPVMHFGLAVSIYGETLDLARQLAFATTLCAVGLWMAGAEAERRRRHTRE